MHKSLILCDVLVLLLLCAFTARGQEGFGTDKPSKAVVIEMKSMHKGLLIPRVALEQLDQFSPIGGADGANAEKTNSLLIFNTADQNDVSPGYYYWSSEEEKWHRLLMDEDGGVDGKSAYEIWLENGNSGSEQDFLDSLIGAQGPQGEQGPPGQDGVVNAKDLLLEDNVLEFLNGTDGSQAVLEETKIGIEYQGITPDKLSPGEDDQVLISNDNEVNWKDIGNLSIEPWLQQENGEKATANDQNIYQEGNVAIGKTDDFNAEVALDVKGAIRGGDPDLNESIGEQSFAVGEDVVASGNNSAAFGYQS